MTTAPKSTSPIRPLISADSLDVTQINAKANSSLPAGFSVERVDSSGSAAEIYTWTGTEWEDGINGGPVTSTAVTGVTRFVNPSSTDIDINW